MKRNIWVIIILILLFPLVLFLTRSKDYSLIPYYASFNSIPKRSEQPQDTLIANAAIPLHHWKTKQDTPVYFIPTEKLQMIDIIVTFNAGSARDGEIFGLASFMADMLEEGTEKHSALHIAQAIENVGAIFSTHTDRDKMSIQLRSIVEPEHLLSTIDLFSEMIAKPSFNEDSVQQLKNQTLVTLKGELQNPNIKALIAFYKAGYGTHPYGHLTIGTLEGIGKISRQDLVDFHKKYLVAKNAMITIVGGIHRDDAKAISERITAALEKGDPAGPLPEVQALKEAVDVNIKFPLQQSHLLLGQPCCAENDPDFFPLLVGNYILGEAPFVARLFKEIRENRGMAYNISSSFRRLKQEGPFIVSLQTKANQEKEAEQLVKKTLKEFIEQGPSEEEVVAAKRGIIGGFPLKIANNAQIAKMVSEMKFYDMPDDYLDTYRNHVEKISREDVQLAFQRRINPDKMVLVVVGE